MRSSLVALMCAKSSKTAAETGLVRLNKLLSRHLGLCSRREADRYIQQGWVKVNGQVVTELGTKLLPALATRNNVQLLAPALREQAKQSTILLNKPLGIVSSQPEGPDQRPAVQLLTHEREFIAPSRRGRRRRKQQRSSADEEYEPRVRDGWAVAGRLDINTTGLLVLTQSGVIAREIIGPESTVEKEYLVRIIPTPIRRFQGGAGSSLPVDTLERLRDGIQHGDDWLQAKHVDQINEDQLQFVLTAGKHHHIRRMCDAVGLTVRAIKRVRIGHVVLGDLPIGQWRYLRSDEQSFV